MDSAKSKYRQLAQKYGLPLQMQPWWWDAVCGADWQVLLAEEKNGDVLAALPYAIRKKGGISVLQPPPFTSYSGPWIKYPAESNFKYPAKRAFEKKVLTSLAVQLPSIPFIGLHLDPKMDNWLPFYWSGFSQTTRYTYRLDLQKDEDSLFQNFKQSLRTDLRKEITDTVISTSDDNPGFYKLIQQSYLSRGHSVPYAFPVLDKLVKACKKNESGTLYMAIDKENGSPVAGLFVAWDDSTVHAIASGQTEKPDPLMQHLFWRAICDHLGPDKIFDFEGSMVEKIEHFLRGFGGKLVPYHRIYKSKNVFWEILGKLSGRWK